MRGAPHREGRRRSLRRARLLSIVLLELVVLAWMRGLVGLWLTRWAEPSFMPLTVGRVVELSTLSDDAPPLIVDRGLMVVISPARMRALARTAAPLARLLPPNTLRNGLVLTGAYAPSGDVPFSLKRLPFVVILDAARGDPPQLALRLTAAEFNVLLREDLQDRMRLRKRYFLGHVDVAYRVELDELAIRSVDAHVAGRPERRELVFDASGELKVRIEENLLQGSGTAKLRHLTGRLGVDIERHADGTGLRYALDIDRLDLNFHNVNRLLDDLTSDRVKDALEASLNKRKRKQKLADKRLPDWVPLDVAFDLRLTTPETGGR